MSRMSDSTLLRSARQARASAARFAAIVDRFGAEMPGHIDRLHEVLADIRHVADALGKRGGVVPVVPAVEARTVHRMAAE